MNNNIGIVGEFGNDYNWETFVKLGLCEGVSQEEKKYLGDLYTNVAKSLENNEFSTEFLDNEFAPYEINWEVVLFAIVRRVYDTIRNLDYISFKNAVNTLSVSDIKFPEEYKSVDTEAEITIAISDAIINRINR